MVSQVLLIVLYAALVEYGDAPNAAVALANSDVDTYYPFYQGKLIIIEKKRTRHLEHGTLSIVQSFPSLTKPCTNTYI